MNGSGKDWRVPQNDNLWQGEAGINNPCPQGYRLPTEAEYDGLVAAEGITNRLTAASSTLAFSAAGARHGAYGSVLSQGDDGHYWCGISIRRSFFSHETKYYTSHSANGFLVRCIQD